MTVRLPAKFEVTALIRQVEAEGGFAMVIAKGDSDGGSILVATAENGVTTKVYERMPSIDGERRWHCSQRLDPANPIAIGEYLARRRAQDGDLWIVELDIVNAERFIGLDPDAG